MQRIVIATPHPRYDAVERRVSEYLASYEVVRLRAREDVSVDILAKINPEYVFFPHWSWRIPDEVVARFECVVFHMTDLPFGRGGSPLQNLLARGIYETKLSALRCSAEIDGGPVYVKRSLSLHGTAEQIYARAAQLMPDMIADIVHKRLQPVAQVGTATYFARRKPEEGNLAPLDRLRTVYDFIRMLDAEGYPPAFVETEHLRFEFTGASLSDDSVVARVCISPRKSRGNTR